MFGGGTVGLVLGAVAINVAAATGILVLALRRGGRALLVWSALLLTAYLFAIDPIPFDIWNPSVTLHPVRARPAPRVVGDLSATGGRRRGWRWSRRSWCRPTSG